ncbi:fimbrial protein [Pantoea sp. SS70]|uniref:fimbrial protein n=1 Tax=Pantoea sp. SS70 TaxID=3024247 RepID=UPI0024534465|nr:fimbrial protein [Pantoea sp. SS70]WGK60081.1 fimbrial protein [Pantoea sp. SS70]
MINKKILFTCFSSLLLSNVASAVTGTVNMDGSLTEQSCQVSADQLTRTINISTLTPERLIGAADNESVASTNIDFDVTACPPSTQNVGIRFDFSPNSSNPEYLNNSGNAEGVAFGITKIDNTLITTGQQIDSTDLDAAQGNATVKAKLQAYRVGSDAPVEGDIASTATVTVITQ